jgi:hypothetical protein
VNSFPKRKEVDVAQARLPVRKIREFLRLKYELGLSDRKIAVAVGSARIIKGSSPAVSVVDQAVSDLFAQLSSKHAAVRSLDVFALARIVRKGPNGDRIKGQLLEELIESRNCALATYRVFRLVMPMGLRCSPAHSHGFP